MWPKNLDSLLECVLTQPTSPFRESWTTAACMSFCEALKLPYWIDSTGNLWVGARSAREVKQSNLVFVAHLDHPGMVITKLSQTTRGIRASGQWLGGGPMNIRGLAVKVFGHVDSLTVLNGKVLSHTKGRRSADKVEIAIDDSPLARAACNPRGLKALGPWGACLSYKEAPLGIAKKKKEWVTKAADDLVGVCAMLYAYWRAGKPKGVSLLLSRAEESGFHGSIEVLQKKLLDPKRTLMVSIETSSQLPGAVLGGGPVVRLGDRATVFNPAAVFWVQSVAEKLKKSGGKKSRFRYQRRVMDGGTCEGTAFNLYGFSVAGLSTPLKNYHNIEMPSGRAAPEAVDCQDVELLTVLIEALMRDVRHLGTKPAGPFAGYKKTLLKNQSAHARYWNGF